MRCINNALQIHAVNCAKSILHSELGPNTLILPVNNDHMIGE